MKRAGQDPHALPLVRHIFALEALGWHLVRLQPSGTGAEVEATLWRATIERHDEGVSMSVTEADPDIALGELLRYAQVDAA